MIQYGKVRYFQLFHTGWIRTSPCFDRNQNRLTSAAI